MARLRQSMGAAFGRFASLRRQQQQSLRHFLYGPVDYVYTDRMTAASPPCATAGAKCTRCRVGRWLLLAALVLVAARATCLQGLIRPVRVAGASMAETLRGDHYVSKCSDCGFSCRFDAEQPPGDERVVCPNCGCVQRGDGGWRATRGDRVLIDRLACLLAPPRRWDLVAVRLSGDAERWAVKRVVGLPGERIAIRAGDLYADGQIQRKSMAQLRSMTLLVHDSQFHVAADRALPPRWAPELATSGWRQEPGRLVYLPESLGEPPCVADLPQGTDLNHYDWLTYRHWRCFSSPLPRTAEYPILDHCGYNQDESRQLQPVTDLLLVGRICVASATGCLVIRADAGRDSFEVVLDFGVGRALLDGNGQRLLAAELPPAPYASGVNVALALCDQRITLAIDEQTVLEHDYSPSMGLGEPPARPLSLGARTSAVSVRRLQVFRDVVYLDPAGLGRDWVAPHRLDGDQFFLLGDNPSQSCDSRQDPQGGVSRCQLLGKVLIMP